MSPTCPMTDRGTNLTTASGNHHPSPVAAHAAHAASPAPGATPVPPRGCPGHAGRPVPLPPLPPLPAPARVKREPAACTADMVRDTGHYSAACFGCDDGEDINNNNNQPSSHNRNNLREFLFMFFFRWWVAVAGGGVLAVLEGVCHRHHVRVLWT